MMGFKDREDAARRLAERLRSYEGRADAVVAAIPRGGVVVGAVLAKVLRLPLEIVLTKKIGHPLQPEYAVGAVDLSGVSLDEALVAREGIPRAYLSAEAARLRGELRRRRADYLGGRPPLSLKGRTVILADDGAATGATMEAAARLARAGGAAWIVAAVPVAPPDAVARLGETADEVVSVLVPGSFSAIGEFYEDFAQVDDERARRLLRESSPA